MRRRSRVVVSRVSRGAGKVILLMVFGVASYLACAMV